VDQAVAFPLPDADSRSRLLDLFGRGLDMVLTDRAAIVAETDGVSPAFLRELVRKAALQAALAGSPRVEDAHFRDALELLERGGSITRSMLGADGGAMERLDPEGDWDDEEWDEE
jgi:ATP-dependent 26S proteasome regulatory subunit